MENKNKKHSYFYIELDLKKGGNIFSLRSFIVFH